MNIVDGLATYMWVTNGIADEKNPLMDFLINIDPLLFLFLKVFIGSFCIRYFWKKPHMAPALSVVFLVYSYVTYLHLNICLHIFLL